MAVKKICSCNYCGSNLSRYPAKTDTYFCDIKCKSKWQAKQRENLGFTKEWLIDQYFNQHKDCNQIGREIGRDGKSVWNWFKYYGIQINKRGANFNKNLCLDGSNWVGRKHTDETKNKIRKARIEDGHVPYLKDGVHWLKHEGTIHPNFKGGLTPERQAFYSSIEWVELVKQVWQRDNATCQNCGKHHNETNNRGTFHIHHIISFQIREHRGELSNLVLLCKKCHRWVHSKDNINKKFIKTWEK